MIKMLVKGTIVAEIIKNGFSFFPRIKIPRGSAKTKALINLKELSEAISGSEKPFFRK
tara:strand:- start:321 stop:494 length:174 start_codon:yes stop_codon:yes gene_type:complete